MGETYNGSESLKLHSNLNFGAGGTQPVVFAGSPEFNMSEHEFM